MPDFFFTFIFLLLSFYLSPLTVQFYTQTDSKDYLEQLKSDVSAIKIQEPGYFAAKDPFLVI